MVNKIWNNLSVDYENQFYTTEYILLPAVLDELKDVKNKNVLDLGSGTGYFSNILYKKGANIIGVDSSEKMIKIAKEKNKNIKYFFGYAENLSKYTKEKFDYVLMVMFFCCINNRQDFDKIFSEIKKVLKKNGKIIIVDYHPKGYKNIDTFLLKHKLPKNFDDQNSPQKFEVNLRNKKDKLLEFFDFHWQIEDYEKISSKLNFQINKIKELRPKQDLKIHGKNVLDYFQNDKLLGFNFREMGKERSKNCCLGRFLF